MEDSSGGEKPNCLVGETVQVKVNRDGEEQSVPVVPGELIEPQESIC